MDALVMVQPPPIKVNGVIRVLCTATFSDETPQITFGVDYQYTTNDDVKKAAILNVAYQAYVDNCTVRGVAPLPANQIRREVVGL